MTADQLADRRILIVEDEILVSMMIENMLKGFGCKIVGPADRLDTALQLARDETFDAAILDVNIRGEKVFPVAELLLERGIPFVLASGYGDLALPESLRGRPRLAKPFTSDEVAATVRALCRPR